jgi:tetratricopeptide (TPR) repeat protein
LLTQGFVAEALPYLQQAGEPGMLGIAQLKLGKLPEAIANLNAALVKHPNDPELLFYLGRASGLLAKEAMDTLESEYSDSARAKQALAENYAALKQLPEAIENYQQALRLRPETPGLHLALGRLYAQTSEWGKAKEQFRAEEKLQPGDAEAAYALGNALLQDGNIKDARAELERANVLRPSMPETLYALGKAASLDGDTAAAERNWTKLLEIEKAGPLAAQAHFGLAALYRKQGRAAEAARELDAYQHERHGAAAR